jgi:hypothetical protein
MIDRFNRDPQETIESAARAETSNRRYDQAYGTVEQVILRGQRNLRITSIEVADRKFIKDLIDYLLSNKDSWSVNIFELQERAIFICALFPNIKNCDVETQVEMLKESKIKPFNTGIIFTDKLYQLLVDRRTTLEQKKAIIFTIVKLFFPTSLCNLIIDYSELKPVSNALLQPHYARLFGLDEKPTPRQVAPIVMPNLNTHFQNH